MALKAPKGEKITKEITFPLTQKRVAELGRENADFDQQITELEIAKKRAGDEFKAKIDALAAKRVENSALIRAANETREVECILVRDFDGKRIRYWHEGRYVDERAMTESELQVEMNLRPSRRPPMRTEAELVVP